MLCMVIIHHISVDVEVANRDDLTSHMSASNDRFSMQGWQVFARRWKKLVSMAKTGLAKIVFFPAKVGFYQNCHQNVHLLNF